ncbi:hypothetical protein CC79DRAFT_1299223 [Sarocladium strictum]
MAPTIELLGRGPVTVETALEEERNVLRWATYAPATDRLFEDLWDNRDTIATIVRHHLGLAPSDRCTVLPRERWIRGGFNLCVFVEVASGDSTKRIVFRVPMPHKLAEGRYPGSVDEKVDTEVGAYIWVEEHCPEIKVPHLFGFGYMDGRHFTHAKQMSIWSRLTRSFWREIYHRLELPLLSNYIWNRPSKQLSSAYLVLEYLGPDVGTTLSTTFVANKDDEDRRARLFKGLSRIMLSLARIPQAKIGSFQFRSNGTIALTNRPLSFSMMISENDGARRTIERDETFTCTDAFVSEALTFHDNRFLNQPNAVYSEKDCRGQMAVKTLLRTISHNFIRSDLRDGPFPLQLTDCHMSNILVDQQWNITGLIDLEWICALPAEMMTVPLWLTGSSAEQLEDEKLETFDKARREFMRIFESEEEKQAISPLNRSRPRLSTIMHNMWESKGTWFWQSISAMNLMYFLVESHLCPPGSITSKAERHISRFWRPDAEEMVQKKLADKETYEQDLRALFKPEKKRARSTKAPSVRSVKVE